MVLALCFNPSINDTILRILIFKYYKRFNLNKYKTCLTL